MPLLSLHLWPLPSGARRLPCSYSSHCDRLCRSILIWRQVSNGIRSHIRDTSPWIRKCGFGMNHSSVGNCSEDYSGKSEETTQHRNDVHTCGLQLVCCEAGWAHDNVTNTQLLSSWPDLIWCEWVIRGVNHSSCKYDEWMNENITQRDIF